MKRIFFFTVLMTISTISYTDVIPYTLNGVEGFFVPRADFEEFMLAAFERDQWKSAFDSLTIEYKKERDSNYFIKTLLPWAGALVVTGVFIGGIYVGIQVGVTN